MNCKRLFQRVVAVLVTASIPYLIAFSIAVNVYQEAMQFGWMFALQPFLFVAGMLAAVVIFASAYNWAVTQLRK